MSQNTNQGRGTKRPSSDLVSTNTNNNNTENPHPPKKQRTSKQKYATTLQSLLQMSPSEINELPEPLKTQAIALRQQRNIKNKNIKINSQKPLQQPISLISDEESDSEQEMEYVTPVQQQQNVNVPVKHNYNNTNQRNNNAVMYSQINNNAIPLMNSNTAFARGPAIPRHVQAPLNGINGINIASNQPMQPVISGVNIPNNQTSLHYNRQAAIQQVQPVMNEVHSNGNSNPNSYSVPRYINMQELIAGGDEKNDGNCGLCYKFWFFICMILLFVPVFMSIQWSNSYGTNYCDTNADVIRALNRTDCIPCPINARYCIGGKARCPNKFMVDSELSECVAYSYMGNVINAYKNTYSFVSDLVVNGCKDVFNYCKSEILKWKSVEEWKVWWKEIWNLSFGKLCKRYEMEIMVSFFILTWYFPMFRLVIIFLWSRMVLPIVNDGEKKEEEIQNIVIGLRVLSYFSPIMFVYVVWNRIAGYFS